MKRISFHPLIKTVPLAIPTIMMALTLFLAGCESMRRSSQSGYAHTNEPTQGLGRDRKFLEKQSTARDMGLPQERSGIQEEAVELRVALKKAEKALEGRREREQYFKNKPYMRSDRERLEFLTLDGFDSRQRWLNSKGILASTTQHPPQVQSIIDVNDIALGFTKQAVKDSWGEPDLVEVSGNPIYGNERWHFSEQTSSTDGYRSQNRVVYFESGRVVGWEAR